MSEYSDLDRQIEQLKRCEIIKENEVKVLCAKAREILVEEGNVQRVDSPVTVNFVAGAFMSLFVFTSHFLGLRRHSRAILRSQRAVQSRWRRSGNQLLVYGRFR